MSALIPENPSPGKFYTLPKIHKLPKLIGQRHPGLIDDISKASPADIVNLAKTNGILPPGRPIISGIGTLTEPLSGFIDSVLNPLISKIPSFVQDTTHFLRILNEIPTLTPNSFLVTMDVSSLYSNIPHVDGIQACREFLTQHGHPVDFVSDMCDLIEFILSHNNFTFKEKHFLQVKGTAMGTRMAPSYANIFMAWFEGKLLNSLSLGPTHYYRYIDDIFFIWPHGEKELLAFYKRANELHDSISFTMERSYEEIPFLDVLVKLKDSTISTSLYTKPTDIHKFLDFNSSHPLSLKRSIVYSQGLRIKRICSDNDDFQHQLAIFVSHLLSCGYPLRLINKEIRKLSNSRRSELLEYKIKNPSSRIPMVFDYHPSVEILSKILRNDYKILRDDESLCNLFSQPPLHAKRQTSNLGSILTSSSLPSKNKTTGNRKCLKPRCQVCNIINCEPNFQPPGTNVVIKPPALTCDSPNVIYLLSCDRCPHGNYIGETSNPFRFRLNYHKKTIRDNTKGYPVAEHFNLPDHSIDDLKCTLISSGFKSPFCRKRREMQWILKLKTHTSGLNRDLGFLKGYTFVNAQY